MTKQELMRLSEEKAPPDLRGSEYLKWACEDICSLKGGQVYRSDVSAVIEQARKYQERYINDDEDAADGSPLHKSLAFSAIINSEMLLADLLPLCKVLRKKLFSTEEPPFSSIREAGEWIERTAEQERQRKLAEYGEERRKAYELVRELSLKYDLGVWLETRSLPYPGEDGWVHRVPIWAKTPLSLLEYWSRRVSEGTGFSQAGVVGWILTGRKPLVPPVTTRTSLCCCNELEYEGVTVPGLTAKQLTVTFRANLSQAEWTSLRGQLNEFFGKIKKKAFNDCHATIWRLVNDCGGPPSKGQEGASVFWETIRNEFNQRHPDKPLRTWNGAKKAYFDVMKRIRGPHASDCFTDQSNQLREEKSLRKPKTCAGFCPQES
ncbi:MAG TPA: hypothetical protein GXX40_02745 [Firmicutes bacterium]|nr:hypothetical protein [Bacillota bacterium]